MLVSVVLLSVHDLWLWLALSAVFGYGAVRMGMVEMKSTEWKRCVPGVREVRYGRCLGCAPSGHACDLLYPTAGPHQRCDPQRPLPMTCTKRCVADAHDEKLASVV